jgi:hypothetical protein
LAAKDLDATTELVRIGVFKNFKVEINGDLNYITQLSPLRPCHPACRDTTVSFIASHFEPSSCARSEVSKTIITSLIVKPGLKQSRNQVFKKKPGFF